MYIEILPQSFLEFVFVWWMVKWNGNVRKFYKKYNNNKKHEKWLVKYVDYLGASENIRQFSWFVW